MMTFIRNIIYLFKHDLNPVVSKRKLIESMSRDLVVENYRRRKDLAYKIIELDKKKETEIVSGKEYPKINKQYKDGRR